MLRLYGAYSKANGQVRNSQLFFQKRVPGLLICHVIPLSVWISIMVFTSFSKRPKSRFSECQICRQAEFPNHHLLTLRCDFEGAKGQRINAANISINKDYIIFVFIRLLLQLTFLQPPSTKVSFISRAVWQSSISVFSPALNCYIRYM